MGRYAGEIRDEPLLGADAIVFLEKILNKKSRVLETGTGASTIWLAERAAAVVSYEHKYEWYLAVKSECKRRSLENVELRYDPNYPLAGLRYLTGSFDLILIDGRKRSRTVKQNYQRVAPGGYLALDDANRPRYAGARKLLAELGWTRTDITSRVTPEGKLGFTTFWKRPEKEGNNAVVR